MIFLHLVRLLFQPLNASGSIKSFLHHPIDEYGEDGKRDEGKTNYHHDKGAPTIFPSKG